MPVGTRIAMPDIDVASDSQPVVALWD
ncbi:hypothetical protein [Brucella sp. 10RB9215]|nr:hypothetical protein [Brucella sp. 10RB9215]